jgi:hypothetical protein
MKKWMYLIFPGAMLGLFLVVYLAESKKTEEREREHATEVARQKKAEDDKQDVLKKKAEADAKKRADDRAAEEAKKEHDRVAKWEAEAQKILDDTNKSKKAGDDSSKKIANAEAELATLRANREKANREYLELLKNVERAKIDRRTAELEIQRTTDMIARKAADSAMTKMPPPPPPPAKS